MIARIFNGSPRKDGLTAHLSSLLKIELESLEVTSEIIHLIDYWIPYCGGGYADSPESCTPENCAKHCPVAEKWPENHTELIFDMLLSSDIIVFSTPVYWWAPSAIIKTLLEKMTSLENSFKGHRGKYLDGKVGGIISVGEEDGAMMAITPIMASFNWMGIIIPPYSTIHVIKRRGELLHPDYHLEIKNMAINLSNLAKLITEKKLKFWNINL